MNQVAVVLDDLKKWLGELFIENKMLQAELNRIRLELEQIKKEVSVKDTSFKEEENEETT